MKRVATAFLFGLSITALIFAAHLTVMNWFSWKDKPMMPNFFTDLLLPAYRLAEAIRVPSPLRFVLAMAFDCVLFGLPVWLLLQIRYLVTRKSE